MNAAQIFRVQVQLDTLSFTGHPHQPDITRLPYLERDNHMQNIQCGTSAHHALPCSRLSSSPAVSTSVEYDNQMQLPQHQGRQSWQRFAEHEESAHSQDLHPYAQQPWEQEKRRRRRRRRQRKRRQWPEDGVSQYHGKARLTALSQPSVVANAVASLGKEYVQYSDTFLERRIDGGLAMILTDNDLVSIGVAPASHRIAILAKFGMIVHDAEKEHGEALSQNNVEENQQAKRVVKEAKPRADQQAKGEAKEQTKGEAKEQAKGEAKEQAKGEAKEQAKDQANEQKSETKEQAKDEAKERAKLETKERAKLETKEQAKGEEKERAKIEAKEQAKPQQMTGAKRDAEGQAKRETEWLERQKTITQQRKLDAKTQLQREAKWKKRCAAKAHLKNSTKLPTLRMPSLKEDGQQAPSHSTPGTTSRAVESAKRRTMGPSMQAQSFRVFVRPDCYDFCTGHQQAPDITRLHHANRQKADSSTSAVQTPFLPKTSEHTKDMFEELDTGANQLAPHDVTVDIAKSPQQQAPIPLPLGSRATLKRKMLADLETTGAVLKDAMSKFAVLTSSPPVGTGSPSAVPTSSSPTIIGSPSAGACSSASSVASGSARNITTNTKASPDSSLDLRYENEKLVVLMAMRLLGTCEKRRRRTVKRVQDTELYADEVAADKKRHAVEIANYNWAATKIQTMWRSKSAWIHQQQLHRAAAVIQSLVRGCAIRIWYAWCLKNVVCIQSGARMWAARRVATMRRHERFVAMKHRERIAAVTVQCLVRVRHARTVCGSRAIRSKMNMMCDDVVRIVARDAAVTAGAAAAAAIAGAHDAHAAALEAGTQHHKALQVAYAEGVKKLAEIEAKKQAELNDERARREAEEHAKLAKEQEKHATWKNGQGDVADSFIVGMQEKLRAGQEQLQTLKLRGVLRAQQQFNGKKVD